MNKYKAVKNISMPDGSLIREGEKTDLPGLPEDRVKRLLESGAVVLAVEEAPAKPAIPAIQPGTPPGAGKPAPQEDKGPGSDEAPARPKPKPAENKGG